MAKEKKLSPQQKYDQIPHELEGVYRLAEDAFFYPEDDEFYDQCIKSYNFIKDDVELGINPWDIPNLRPDMLVEELSDNIEAYVDQKVTPDDGSTTWLVNVGSVSLSPELPFDRCIYAFFTTDNQLEKWWKETSYRVGQMLNLGVDKAIAPDFSLWDYNPYCISLLSIYKSNWVGRFFQETGKIRVIPRVEFFDPFCREFSLAGIPKGAPVIATQMHTTITDELIPQHQNALEQIVDMIGCKEFLIYVSPKGKELVEAVNLPCKVRLIEAVAKKRKPRKKISDPHLLELKRRPDKKGALG